MWILWYLYCVYLVVVLYIPCLSFDTREKWFRRALLYVVLPWSYIRLDHYRQDDKGDKLGQEINIPDRILCVCNHPGVFDAVFLSAFHERLFPDHRMIFTMKESLGNLPLVGWYMKERHILLSRHRTTDETRIRRFFDEMRKTTPEKQLRYVVYIFVEATSMCHETRVTSERRFQERHSSCLSRHRPHHWKHLLFPYTGGLYHCLPYVDHVLDGTLVISPSLAGQYERQYLGWSTHIPERIEFFFKPWMSRTGQDHIPIPDDKTTLQTILTTLWYEKDEWISSLLE